MRNTPSTIASHKSPVFLTGAAHNDIAEVVIQTESLSDLLNAD